MSRARRGTFPRAWAITSPCHHTQHNNCVWGRKGEREGGREGDIENERKSGFSKGSKSRKADRIIYMEIESEGHTDR